MGKIIISISAITDKVRRGVIDNWRLLEDTKEYKLFEFQTNKWYKNIQVKVTKSHFTITTTPISTRGREDEINDYHKDIIVDFLSVGLPEELKKVKL